VATESPGRTEAHASDQPAAEPPAAARVWAPGVRVDLRLTLRPLRLGPRDPTLSVTSDRAVRAWRTPTGPATLQVTVRGGTIAAEAWGEGAAQALASVEGWLGLDDAEADSFDPPALRALRGRVRGLRVGRTGSVLDALVAAILQQRVATVDAFAALLRLATRHGERAPGPAGLRLLPDGATLLAIRDWEWHRLGVEQRRALTIRRVADVADRLEEAARLPAAEAYRRLRSVCGVGPWTVASVAARALGDPDAVPVGDLHLPALVAWNLAGEARADDRRMLELLEPYRGQRGRVILWLQAAGAPAPRFGPRLPASPPAWS
jgi:3-methyladenine DNA glycosylase/8-oxoguanine DNA glycosylase